MAGRVDTERMIFEQEKVRETLATEGARIIAAKLHIVAEATRSKEQQADPFKYPGEIAKARQLRYVIETLLPQILEGVVNYDPDAPDKQVAPKDKWTVASWLKKVFGKSQVQSSNP